MLIENDFVNVPARTLMQTNIPKKVSSFVLGGKTSLVKILTEKRGAMQSGVFKLDGQISPLLICILRACPLINIGRRTLVGRGNGQMVHFRNGTPEHCANIISSCQISSHLIKIIATFIVIINSVILTGAITVLHLIRASLA